jgi:hypothetical protein
MIKQTMLCAVAAAVALAIFAAFYLEDLSAAGRGWRGLTSIMAYWGVAGSLVVTSVAALTLSEVFAPSFERAAGVFKRAD